MIGKQRRTPGAVSPHEGFFTSPPTSPLYAPLEPYCASLPRPAVRDNNLNPMVTLPRMWNNKANKVRFIGSSFSYVFIK